MNVLMFQEAVASTALTHPVDCLCRVCRAAGGDETAMAELVEQLEPEIDGNDRPSS